MILRIIISIMLLLVSASIRLTAQPVLLRDAFPSLGFSAPVDVQHPGDGTNRLFIVRQTGYIYEVENTTGATSAKTFLDIHTQVRSGGELGLLGLAFHPSYEVNGHFFVNYTRDTPLRTVVSRFTVSSTNPDSADPASEVVFLEVNQPYTNHNGGQLAFGPDGYLYIALGDGGSGGDPQNNGQNTTSLLGKILRINIDVPSDTTPYSIPADNPFANNTAGYRKEIFAYGLRNPWRFSFDAVTGIPWIGDVGQGAWEEVDIMINGGNYGWRLKEGTHCYNPSSGCDTIAGLIDPVWEYAHDGQGGCSITGGYLYRGRSIPSLYGKYLYGDYCSGRIWALDTIAFGEPVNVLVLDTDLNITSFGIDRDNEIYVCSPGDATIYKLVALYPPTPVLLSPANASTNVPANPDLRWSASPSAIRYHLQVAKDADFSMLTVNDTTLTDTSFLYVTDPGITAYFWRVRARNTEGWSPFSPTRTFSTNETYTGLYNVKDRWNLISLPLTVADGRKDSVFPSAISSAFGFDPKTGYEERDSLIPGQGYWLKFAAAKEVTVTGIPRYEDTLVVLPGWNLIGGISGPVPIDSIIAEPPGIIDSPFFTYNGSYNIASSLDPMQGYWVKVSGSGFLILRASGGITESGTRPHR